LVGREVGGSTGEGAIDDVGSDTGVSEHAPRITARRPIAKTLFILISVKKSGLPAAFFELSFDATECQAADNLLLQGDINDAYRCGNDDGHCREAVPRDGSGVLADHIVQGH
jgi:hypothetical protein